jgi:hypothetical protein
MPRWLDRDHFESLWHPLLRSNLIGIRADPCSRPGKLALFEGRDVFGCGLRGPLQARSMEPHRLSHGIGMLIPQANDELVGVYGLDVELADD